MLIRFSRLITMEDGEDDDRGGRKDDNRKYIFFVYYIKGNIEKAEARKKKVHQ